MRSSSNTLRISKPMQPTLPSEETPQASVSSEPTRAPAQPQLVRPANGGNGRHEEQSLRMYTEEQVAEMLQVSLSQLRKWRMKQYDGQRQGPPFRKIGRLVRYPEAALRAYINGEITL